jgi:hypothetical protein
MTHRAIHQPVNLHSCVRNRDHLIRCLFVTFQAPAHCLIDHARDAFHLAHITVARLTRDLRAQVWHVRKENTRLGPESVNALPLRLRLILNVFEYLLNFRVIWLDLLVAKSALRDAWNEHMRRLAFTIFVAEGASNLFAHDVGPVAVGYRLLGCILVASRRRVDDSCDQRQQDYSCSNEPLATQANLIHQSNEQWN